MGQRFFISIMTLAFISAMIQLATSQFVHADAAAMIKIDGSSTVFPITEAVSEEFQKSKNNKIRVTVGISGTGGGFKKFCRGETDVQNASRPIQAKEMEDCKAAGIKYYELPVAFDAMAIVVHPKNNWLTNITVSELKKMWEPEAQGQITKWNQVNPQWPDQPLKLFGAGSDSGTFDYFTEAVVGKAKSSRGDYTASEDDNTLVQGVSAEKTSIGYIPFSYYEDNKTKLKLIGVIGGEKAPLKGKPVMPSRASVENGTYYPLSRPLFIYVSEKAASRPEVMEFAQYYLAQAKQLVVQVKYVPLPAKAYEMAQGHLKKGKLGTVFGGASEVGLKINDLLKREAKL